MCKYVDHKGSAVMLAVTRSAGVTPVFNLRNPLHAGGEACKQEIYSGFEIQGRRHQKSKTGVSVVPQKRTDVLQIFFLKRRYKSVRTVGAG